MSDIRKSDVLSALVDDDILGHMGDLAMDLSWKDAVLLQILRELKKSKECEHEFVAVPDISGIPPGQVVPNTFYPSKGVCAKCGFEPKHNMKS